MTKYILLFLIAAQSLCYSENIKFYIFDSKHGNELKPDSVILENVTTKKRTFLLTDTLILTEVGSSPQAFINTSPDFKAKANIINNNIEIDIDNAGAENISIELYGYIGNTIYSEETPINIGVTRKNISLENVNDKLLFLRIKSANSIQTIKLNRTISDFAYEATPIFKSGDEILNGDKVDTAYKYNLYIYKKGYRDYSDLNISFSGKKYYVANLVEKTQFEKISVGTVSISGITIINQKETSTAYPELPPTKTISYDTVNLFTGYSAYSYLGGQYCQCGDCIINTDLSVIDLCYSDNKLVPQANDGVQRRMQAKVNASTQDIENPDFTYCTDYREWYGASERASKFRIKLTSNLKFVKTGNKYMLTLGKKEILDLLAAKQINIENNDSYAYYMHGGYLLNGVKSSILAIYKVDDNAKIEFTFSEE